MLKQFHVIVLVALAATSVVTACSDQSPSPLAPAPTASATLSAHSATNVPPTKEVASVGTPPASSTAFVQSLSEAPRFTHPTDITNSFYPVSLIGQAISLGTKGGQPFRTEVTLLPDTKMIAWDGQQIEARMLQYLAYADGKLVEVAYDAFAQADDSSVYCLGEDVSNYKDGQVVDHRGSWLAGKDGAPPALIMPAHPQVGHVFNSKNLPGVVYETDEILSLAEKTATPAGPIDNGLLIKEVLMGGSIEYKINAANFGIVESRAENEQVNLVWLNRTDAQPGNVPEPLSTIEAQAEDIMDVVPGGNWERVTADVAAINGAWQAYRSQAANDKTPQQFQEALTNALDRLQKTSAAKETADTLQAANDLSAAVVDLFTMYRPTTPTDLGRLDVLGRQVVQNVAANDFTAAADSLAKTNAVWIRLKPVVLAHHGSDLAAQFENNLTTQQEALNTENASVLTTAANDGLELVDALEGLF